MLAYRVTSDRKLSSPRICDNYCDSSGTHTNSYRVYLGTCRPAACGSGGSWPPHMSSLGCQETEQPKGRQQVSRDGELGRTQTGKATRATTLSVPQRQALCSSWEELLSQEGLPVSSEGAARSEGLAGGTPGSPAGVSLPPGAAHNSSWATESLDIGI